MAHDPIDSYLAPHHDTRPPDTLVTVTFGPYRCERCGRSGLVGLDALVMHSDRCRK